MSFSNVLVTYTSMAAGVTFASTLLVYILTAPHGIPGGDAGELVSEACSLGVAHPPGYPLYTLLVHIAVKLLNLSSIAPAHASNLLSATFSAAAAALLCSAVASWVGGGALGAASGMLAAACFSFGELTWVYAIEAEVFALNNLAVAALLRLVVLYFVDDEWRVLAMRLGALTCGLALSNQHTAVLYCVPFCLCIAADARGRGVLTARGFGVLLFFGLVGLSPYVYLWFAGFRAHPGSWGDTSTLFGFLSHVLRMEYGTFRLTPSGAGSSLLGTVHRILAYFNDVRGEFGDLGTVAALIGAATSIAVGSSRQGRKGSRTLGLTVLSAFATYVTVFHTLSNLSLDLPMAFEVHRRFWMQPHLLVAAWLGIGAHTIADYLRVTVSSSNLFVPRSTPNHRSKRPRKSIEQASVLPPAVAMAMVLIALAVSRATLRWEHMRAYHTTELGTMFQEHGESILNSIDDGVGRALLVSTTDLNWNSVRYLQQCEGAREDIMHVNLHLVAFPWFARQHAAHDGVAFPSLRPSVTMEPGHRERLRFVADFLLVHANLAPLRGQSDAHLGRKAESESGGSEERFPGGVYLDLHALEETAIVGANLLGDTGLRLLPHGPVWRVVSVSHLGNDRQYDRHKLVRDFDAWVQVEQRVERLANGARVEALSPEVLARLVLAGSWEEAVVHTRLFAEYQAALFALSIATAISPELLLKHDDGDAPSKKRETERAYLSALAFADRRLRSVSHTMAREPSLSGLKSGDVQKNAALAASRLCLAIETTTLKSDEAKRIAPVLSGALPWAREVLNAYLVRAPLKDPARSVFERISPILDQLAARGEQTQSTLSG